MNSSVIYPVQKVTSSRSENTDDHIAVEEPLEIRISFLNENRRTDQPLSITMRTPGNDRDLAAGFLLTEGIIHKKNDIESIRNTGENIVIVKLTDSITPDINKLERHFYTSSSCGVCGKTSIEAIRTLCPVVPDKKYSISINPGLIYSLPQKLRDNQETFDETGGLHAAALFDENGELLQLREDVGRHNAVDKLIGSAMLADELPLLKTILLLSGRASFELIQKATMAGITFVCAVGAPSSLAVQLAKEREMTLIGFLRGNRFNIYNEM